MDRGVLGGAAHGTDVIMGRYFYPVLFDAEVFGAEVDAADVATLDRLVSNGVEREALTEAERKAVDNVVMAVGAGALGLDNASVNALDKEFDIGSRRVVPDGLPCRGSRYPDLVGAVQEGVWTAGRCPAVDELGVLLDHVNGIDGGRFGDLAEPFVGYLLPGEIRRAAELLGTLRFADPGQESDRQLLLEIFSISARDQHGLFWWWC